MSAINELHREYTELSSTFYSMISRFEHAKHVGQRISDDDVARLTKLEQACQEILTAAVPLASEATFPKLLNKACDLKTALFKTVRLARPPVPPQRIAQPPITSTQATRAAPLTRQAPHSKEARCFICFVTPNHTADGCAKFLAMSVDERVKVVGNGSRCWLCLGYGHNNVDCVSGIVCQMVPCGKPTHHSLLHGARRYFAATPSTPSTSSTLLAPPKVPTPPMPTTSSTPPTPAEEAASAEPAVKESVKKTVEDKVAVRPKRPALAAAFSMTPVTSLSIAPELMMMMDQPRIPAVKLLLPSELLGCQLKSSSRLAIEDSEKE